MPGAAQQRVRSGPSPAARLRGGLEVRRGALSSELESEMQEGGCRSCRGKAASLHTRHC